MKTIACTAIAATAGLATANPISNTGLILPTLEPAGAGDSLLIDVSGFEFFDELGSSNNQSLNFYAFFGEAHITSISWDLNLTTLGASWASDSMISVNGNNLIPAPLDNYSVTNMKYSGSASINIDLMSLDDYLTLEFFESFIDSPGEAEAFFEAGSTITVHGPLLWLLPVVPSPSTLGALGLAGPLTARRRR